jgi:hypothetical protein
LSSPSPFTFAREQADKFLLDGEFFLSKGLAVKDYVQRVRKLLIETGAQVTDFAWERLRPLRIFTAQVFDQKGLLELLPHVSSLEVAGPSELARWYYAAWVCTVLGEEGKKVSVVTRQTEEVRVDFRFRGSSHPLVIEVDYAGMGRAFFGGEEVLSRPLKVQREGGILLEQVDVPIADPVYPLVTSTNLVYTLSPGVLR